MTLLPVLNEEVNDLKQYKYSKDDSNNAINDLTQESYEDKIEICQRNVADSLEQLKYHLKINQPFVIKTKDDHRGLADIYMGKFTPYII